MQLGIMSNTESIARRHEVPMYFVCYIIRISGLNYSVEMH